MLEMAVLLSDKLVIINNVTVYEYLLIHQQF
jgi:hypothetical protein